MSPQKAVSTNIRPYRPHHGWHEDSYRVRGNLDLRGKYIFCNKGFRGPAACLLFLHVGLLAYTTRGFVGLYRKFANESRCSVTSLVPVMGLCCGNVLRVDYMRNGS